MLIALLALVSVASTVLGGLLALKFQDRLHRILGFTAGVLLGVVAFDLLPEIFELLEHTGTDPVVPMVALVVGFLGFHTFEKLTILHHAHGAHAGDGHKHPKVGLYSALAIAAHSFVDGMAIGLAFQVNAAVGAAVAIAVIAHNFSDGLNTVTLMLAHKNTRGRAIKLLAVDAVAPLLGAASTLLFTLNESQLLLFVGFFTGFLLYIGASSILPEAHAKRSSPLTLVLTASGAAFIFLITRFGLEH